MAKLVKLERKKKDSGLADPPYSYLEVNGQHSILEGAEELVGSQDEADEAGRFMYLQIYRTTTTTSTSTTTLSTFTLCISAVSSASSCYWSGRRKRRSATANPDEIPVPQ